MAGFVQTVGGNSDLTSNGEEYLSPAKKSVQNTLTRLLRGSIETQLIIEREHECADVLDGDFDALYRKAEVEAVLNSDAELSRLLIARNNDISKATDMALEMIRIRTRIDIKTMPPSEIPTALEQGTLRWSGYDKEGSPILICRSKEWRPWEYQHGAEEYTKYVFYLLSLLVSSMTSKNDQFVCIFVMGNYNARMMGPVAMKCTKAMIDVVQKCFPERAKAVYLVEHPFVFSLAWKVIRPWIAQKTRSKVNFLDGSVESYGPRLCELIEESELEVDLGGSMSGFYPTHEKGYREEMERIDANNK